MDIAIVDASKGLKNRKYFVLQSGEVVSEWNEVAKEDFVDLAMREYLKRSE